MNRIQAFYNATRWGGQFGRKDKLHPNGKTGMDIEWPQHTKIPVLFDSRIVGVNLSTTLGQTCTIEILHGYYAGHFMAYRHIIGRQKLGLIIPAGNNIGEIAGPKDKHGTAWTGPHLDITLGTTPHVWAGIGTENPASMVRYGITHS